MKPSQKAKASLFRTGYEMRGQDEDKKHGVGGEYNPWDGGGLSRNGATYVRYEL